MEYALIQKSRIKMVDTPNRWKNKKVLIVEDDFASQLLLQEILSKFHMSLILADDGLEALKIMRQQGSFDLIILDIKMPHVDGFDVLKKLRNYQQNVPVIAHTSSTSEQDQNKIFNAGFDGFSPKPISIDKLIKVLELKFNS